MEEELKETVTKFIKRSQEKFDKFKDRIKSDRDYLAGDQYCEEDDKILGKKRARSKLDVINNIIRAITNEYMGYPYKVKANNPELNELYNKLSKNYNDAVEQGLKSAVSYGIGYICCLPNQKNDIIVPDTYAIQDPMKVFFDPDSTEIDSTDANECAIYDIKSKNWLRTNYGIEALDTDNKEYYGIKDVSLEKDELILITYFKLENGICSISKLCNGIELERTDLQINHLPIIPVYGDNVFLDKEYSWQGIVRQMKPVQRLVNYSYTQLLERLSKSPKNIFLTTKEAVENNEEYYKNSDKNINQLLEYNKYDKKGQLNEKPEVVNQNVQYDDLTNIMNGALSMAQSVVGVQTIGIPEERSEITATEALLNEKSFTNNIRHYFQHLKYAVERLGNLIKEYVGVMDNIIVESGPADNMERQMARAELAQLVPLLTEPQDRKQAVLAIASTMNDNQYVAPFIQAVSTPDPMIGQLQQQIQMLQQNFNNELGKKELQIEELKTTLVAMKERKQEAIDIAAMNNQTKVQVELLKQNATDDRTVFEEQEETKREAMKNHKDFEEKKLNILDKVVKGVSND